MKYGEKQIEFLERKQYLKAGETLEQRIEEIASKVREYERDYSLGLGDRIKSYIEEQIFIPSTPQWSNFGRKVDKGSMPLPASCYILGVQNSIQGIYYSLGEAAICSKLGGGVGANYTQVYDKGTKLDEGFYSNSKLDWMEDMAEAGQKVSQSSVRRGYVVPFISIEDAEFYDLLARADKKNPDKRDPFVDNNVGIILPKGFWGRLPNEPELQKRFLALMQIRQSSGKIYIVDEENCDKNKSPVYDRLNLTPSASNICTEALTPIFSDKSFVCVLSSLNLKYWDTIKENPQIIKDALMFLDINVSEYIKLTDGVMFLEKARRSAIEKRDIGLGSLGFHELLQMKGMEFGGLESRRLNKEIYSTIRKYAEEYAQEVGEKLGSPKLCEDAGLVRRNVSLMMIAPNKTTSYLAGETSLGVEPFMSNYFVKALSGIKSTYKNPHLEQLLESKGKNIGEVWDLILRDLGSVQRLDFLSKEERAVFKTASEISPKDIIDLAADRQVYIDMSQSINLWNRPNYTLQDVYKIHKYAFSRGLKTLYYFYAQAHASIEKDGEKWDTCASCAD
jgi:ribonucleoside-diphosphate reductase alpha chain